MKSPVSFAFVAANLAVQAKGFLYRFKPARLKSPSWDGSGNPISPREVTSPVTDKSWWADRYALCELTFRKEDGSQLVMNDAVCSVSRQKNIVTTQMVGMDGTVKEYINAGDYQVSIIVGVIALIGGQIVDEYPLDGIRELRSFFDENAAIAVHSEFLDLFDINRIVIKSFSATQDTASNYQTVNVSALSDEEYNVYSTEY